MRGSSRHRPAKPAPGGHKTSRGSRRVLVGLAMTVSLLSLPSYAQGATRPADPARPPSSSPSTSPPSKTSSRDQAIPVCRSETYPFLEERRPLEQEALLRARRWLDALKVDPFELRAVGIKGKKTLVELLDTYARFWQIADA